MQTRYLSNGRKPPRVALGLRSDRRYGGAVAFFYWQLFELGGSSRSCEYFDERYLIRQSRRARVRSDRSRRFRRQGVPRRGDEI